MEDFDYTYTYEDDELIHFQIESNQEEVMDTKSILNASINLEHDIYPAVKNDLNMLQKKKFEEKIIIESIDVDTLHITILENKNYEQIARFDLQFNKKYPFEAPKMKFLGPKYDFMTNVILSYNFKTILHENWSIKESIHSIINEMLMLILDKKKRGYELFWTTEEMDIINLLKEINFFKDYSFFEEYNERTNHYGKGVGYSKDSKTTTYSENIEHTEKQKIELFLKCFNHFCKDEFKNIITHLELCNKFCTFIKKNSYLYVSKLKDNLYKYKSIFNDPQYDTILSNKINLTTQFSYLENENNSILEDDVEDFLKTHYFYDKKNKLEPTIIQKLFKRILIDIFDLKTYINEMELHQDTLSMIRFVWSPDSPQYLKFIIVSENEPYLGGMFEFHAFFPEDYPLNPPKVQLITTGNNTIRFNPNLYADGKVCLSLLGTWSGEQWSPAVNNLVHIIQAISVMILTDQPVQNEPAYSTDKYFDHPDLKITNDLLLVRKYKYQIKYFTLKLAIIDQLKDKTSVFHKFYEKYFFEKKEQIMKSFEYYLSESKTDNFISVKNAKSFQSNSESLFKDYPGELESLLQKLKML